MKIKEIREYRIFESFTSPVAFFLKDYSLLWANDSYCRFVGINDRCVAGKRGCDLVRCNADNRGCPVSKVFDLKDSFESEIKFYTAQSALKNSESCYKVTAFPLTDENNHLYGAGVFLSDVSSYHNQLKKYKDSRDALLRILEYSSNHNSKELLREFLDEAESLTGSKIGFYHFVDEDEKSLQLSTWSTNTLKLCQACAEGRHYPVENAGIWVDSIRMRKSVIHNDYSKAKGRKGVPEGHVPLKRELVVPVIRGDKIKAVLGVGNKDDYYDDYDLAVIEQLADLAFETVVRKQAQELNKKLEEQFAHAGRMEAIGRLAGGVAHDFNNMLSVIMGNCELALEKTGSINPVADHLKEIEMAARRSAELSKQLLVFARKQNVVPQQLNINSVISDMLKMLARLIGEDIELAWNPCKNPFHVKIDPMQIDQILANLCINAKDSIEGGGRIIIETENVVFSSEDCQINPEFTPGNYIMLSITDTGAGIEKDEQKHIFEPFYTTKEKGKGTGLGLSTVYGIVRQNGGFIHVYSEKGRGTSFKIYFPAFLSSREKTKEELKNQVVLGNKETILLVEDEKMILNLGEKILSSLGYSVIGTSSPAEAVELSVKHKNSVRLLITDVIMPGMNGKELSEKIKEIIPDIKIIFMSAYTSNVISDHGVLEKGIEFIRKPFSKNEFSSKISKVLLS